VQRSARWVAPYFIIDEDKNALDDARSRLKGVQNRLDEQGDEAKTLQAELKKTAVRNT